MQLIYNPIAFTFPSLSDQLPYVADLGSPCARVRQIFTRCTYACMSLEEKLYLPVTADWLLRLNI